MLYEEKTMKSEKLYEGKILTLRVDTVELPNRKYSKREIVEHSGAVAIVPVTDKNEIVIIPNKNRINNKIILFVL